MSKLPILMYHNITPDLHKVEALTVSVQSFEAQLKYLKYKKYVSYHLSELQQMKAIAPKSVVITFDDVTVNQLEYAVPLLLKYEFKATFFIPFAYIGQTDAWNRGVERLMSVEQLQSLGSTFELGLHSYQHRAFAQLPEDEIHADFEMCYAKSRESNLKVFSALAYPYGNYPKREPERSSFFKILKSHDVNYGLRIGNRVNRFPFKNPYEIKRLDVRGTDALWNFKFKLKYGKMF